MDCEYSASNRKNKIWLCYWISSNCHNETLKGNPKEKAHIHHHHFRLATCCTQITSEKQTKFESDKIMDGQRTCPSVDAICVLNPLTRINQLLNKVNSAHANVKFIIEVGLKSGIAFLDVPLSRREDVSVRRSLQRKVTWKGQYTYFRSFVHFNIKWDLIRCPTTRPKRTCTEVTFEAEL